jgi:hypothetical protein
MSVVDERDWSDVPPQSWGELTKQYPELTSAYNALSEVCQSAGPLDRATVKLVKLAGFRAPGAGCRVPFRVLRSG